MDLTQVTVPMRCRRLLQNLVVSLGYEADEFDLAYSLVLTRDQEERRQHELSKNAARLKIARRIKKLY